MKKTSKERRDDLFYESLRSYIEALNEAHRSHGAVSQAVIGARDLTMGRARGAWDLELVNFLWNQRTTEPLDLPEVLTVQFLNGEIKKKRLLFTHANPIPPLKAVQVVNELAVLERQKALLLALTWIDTGVENAHQIEEMGLVHERDLDGG